MEAENLEYDISNESPSRDPSLESIPFDNVERNEFSISNSVTSSSSELLPDNVFVAESASAEENSNEERIMVPPSQEDHNAKYSFSSSDQLSFDDWHFVDKSVDANASSDDESIVIIEREVCRQDDFTMSENESDNEQENVNISSPSSFTESIIADKNIKTVQIQSDEFYSLVELQTSPISHRVTEIRMSFWLHHYMILCTVIASLCLLHRITAPLYSPWRSHDYRNSGDDVNVPFTGNVSPDESPALMDYLQENIKLKKAIFDDIFARQADLLKHIKHLKNNLYVLNVSEFAQKRSKTNSLPKHKSIFNLLNSNDELLPCEYDVENDKLPNVCQDNQDILLLLSESQLVSLYDIIGNFFQNSYDKYNDLDDHILATMTKKPFTAFEKNMKEATSFVQDCDSFSKNYRSNFCLKTNPEDCVESCNDAIQQVKDESTQTFEKTESSFNFDKELVSEKADAHTRDSDATVGEMNAEKDNVLNEDEHEERRSKKVVQRLRNFIAKFKEDFESLYQSYVEADDVEEYETKSNEFKMNVSMNDAARNVTNVENSSEIEMTGAEAPPAEESENPHVVSGDWLFNLNAARAKLRHYYENAVNGDWILKLGKAREKLRKKFHDSKEKFEKNFNKEHKQETKSRNRYWFKKAPEKLKSDFKKFSSKWKSQFKRMKNGILEKYEKYVPSDWQFNFKNMWYF